MKRLNELIQQGRLIDIPLRAAIQLQQLIQFLMFQRRLFQPLCFSSRHCSGLQIHVSLAPVVCKHELDEHHLVGNMFGGGGSPWPSFSVSISTGGSYADCSV
jgi:hypothetical protein